MDREPTDADRIRHEEWEDWARANNDVASPGIMEFHALLDEAEMPCIGSVYERLRALVADYNHLVNESAVRCHLTNRERLLEALTEDRNLILQSLADACLEEGRDAEAKGWAWLAATRRWPGQVSSGGWLWGPRYPSDDVDPINHRLPYLLQTVIDLEASRRGVPRYLTALLALQAVVAAIAEDRWCP